MGGVEAARPGKRIRAVIVAAQRERDDENDDSRADYDPDDVSAARGWAEAMFLRENREYLDWWLMGKFPGRTLEELDRVDWLRLQRAIEVGRIVDVEQKNALIIDGKLDGDTLTGEEWQAIRRHNRLYEAVESGET